MLDDYSHDDVQEFYEETSAMATASEELAREAAAEQDRALVKFFHRGFDGIDIHLDGALGIRFVPWNGGDEPEYPPWDGATRYSFGGITYQDIREHHTPAEAEE